MTPDSTVKPVCRTHPNQKVSSRTVKCWRIMSHPTVTVFKKGSCTAPFLLWSNTIALYISAAMPWLFIQAMFYFRPSPNQQIKTWKTQPKAIKKQLIGCYVFLRPKVLLCPLASEWPIRIKQFLLFVYWACGFSQIWSRCHLVASGQQQLKGKSPRWTVITHL